MAGCTNYWNFDNNLIDQINPSYSLTGAVNTQFVADRNNVATSALYLNDGYASIPSASVSWNGDFTIAAWVFVQSFVQLSKLIDCGVYKNKEISVNMNWGMSIWNTGAANFVLPPSMRPCCQWQHIAVTKAGSLVNFYMNAVVVGGGETKQVANVSANYGSCYIGKSLGTEANLNAYVDELWMFSRGLSQAEISTVMQGDSRAPVLANYWNFNSNIVDSVTGSSLTTATGYSFVSDRNGNSNSAVYLNGSQWFKLPTAVYFTGSAFAVTAWVKMLTTNGANRPRLLDCGSSTLYQANVIASLQGGTNTFPVQMGIALSYSSYTSTQLSVLTIVAGVWHHYAYVFTGSLCIIYVDGIAYDSAACNPPANANRSSCYFGQTNYGSDGLPVAYFDEIRFYSTSLTQIQVQAVMNIGTSIVTSLSTLRSLGMTMIWTFNQNLYESMTGLSLISASNMAYVTDRAGLLQSAVYLNSGSLSLIVGSYFMGDFTISAWVNVQSFVNNASIFDCGTLSTGVNQVVMKAAFNGVGQPYFGYGFNNIWTYNPTTSVLPINVWTHVAVSLANTVATTFINGTQVSQVTTFTSSSNLGPQMRKKCFIGYSHPTGVTAKMYVDDLIMFDRPLSTSEIFIAMNTYISVNYLSLMQNYWNFNNNIVDSVTGTSLSTTTGYSFVNDRNGNPNSAIYLDGTQWLQISDAIWFSGAFTVTAWVNMLTTNGANKPRLLDCGTSTADQANVIMTLPGQNAVWFGIVNSGTYTFTNLGVTIAANVWRHYANVFTGSQCIIYLDGVGYTPVSCNTPTLITRTSCFFAKSNYGGDALPVAYFDEIRLFSGALTQTQVQSVMSLTS